MFKSYPLKNDINFGSMGDSLQALSMQMGWQKDFGSRLQVPYMGLAAIITGKKMRLVFSDEHTININGYSED